MKSTTQAHTNGRTGLRTALLALTLISVFSMNASAARYLVMLKDKSSLKSMQTQLAAKPATMNHLPRVSTDSPEERLLMNDTRLVKTLPALNSVVVNTNDEETLRQLEAEGSIAAVVKEHFFKSPRPVHPRFQLMPVRSVQMSKTFADDFSDTATLTRPWGIDAVKAPQAWKKVGTGRNVKLLILDTGVDKDHPAIRPNLAKAKNFVATPAKPYDYADEVGHGTHVAGTSLGARLGLSFSGVAPDASLYVGRVCDTSSCSNIAVAEGINWGITEKVDVINMSLGGTFGSKAEYLAVKAAETAGVIVVAASGNDGHEYVSYPAAFATSIAVGAVDPTMKKASFSNWGPELDVVAPGVGVDSAVPAGSGRESSVVISIAGSSRRVNSAAMMGAADSTMGVESDLVDCQLGKAGECPKEVKGRIALISRGQIPFVEKVKTAEAAGAIGVVIYNNEPGLVSGSLQDHKVDFPVVTIEQSSGNELVAALKAGKPSLVEIKTIAADYGQMSGTSMASPHVAGVVTLMKAANPKLTPEQAREVLKRSSTKLSVENGQNQVGAGMVNAEAAVELARSLN